MREGGREGEREGGTESSTLLKMWIHYCTLLWLSSHSLDNT